MGLNTYDRNGAREMHNLPARTKVFGGVTYYRWGDPVPPPAIRYMRDNLDNMKKAGKVKNYRIENRNGWGYVYVV